MTSPGDETFSALANCADVWAAQVVPPVGRFQVVSMYTFATVPQPRFLPFPALNRE